MLKESDTFLIPDNLFIEEIGDEMVILDEQSGEYFGLDTVGMEIWRLLKRNMSIAEIIDYISSEYDTDRETVYKDTYNFLNNLVTHRLLIKSN